MKLVHIIGTQNSGKTTLIAELIKELTQRGLKTGTIKHSPHDHELDKKGKDSHVHREAGAVPASIICKNMTGVFIPHAKDTNPFETLLPLYESCDLVIIEGFVNGPGKKIEVFRKETKNDPKALGRDDILALISDDEIDIGIPVWPRKNITKLADSICQLVGI